MIRPTNLPLLTAARYAAERSGGVAAAAGGIAGILTLLAVSVAVGADGWTFLHWILVPAILAAGAVTVSATRRMVIARRVERRIIAQARMYPAAMAASAATSVLIGPLVQRP